jgi:hypothetical protein
MGRSVPAPFDPARMAGFAAARLGAPVGRDGLTVQPLRGGLESSRIVLATATAPAARRQPIEPCAQQAPGCSRAGLAGVPPRVPPPSLRFVVKRVSGRGSARNAGTHASCRWPQRRWRPPCCTPTASHPAAGTCISITSGRGNGGRGAIAALGSLVPAPRGGTTSRSCRPRRSRAPRPSSVPRLRARRRPCRHGSRRCGARISAGGRSLY